MKKSLDRIQPLCERRGYLRKFYIEGGRCKDGASRPARSHGAEVSVNTIPAGGSVPFVHAHKANEEIYFILSGKGKIEIDGQSVDLVEGDWLRIAPEGRRRIFASPDSPIGFICIQVKAGSLGAYTADDALA